ELGIEAGFRIALGDQLARGRVILDRLPERIGGVIGPAGPAYPKKVPDPAMALHEFFLPRDQAEDPALLGERRSVLASHREGELDFGGGLAADTAPLRRGGTLGWILG